MRNCGGQPFVGVTTVKLVIKHEEQYLVNPDGTLANYAGAVFTAMLLQIMKEYRGLGDFRKLTKTEIKFFYDGLRAELKHKVKDG